jgi:hypothetical protein
MADGPTASPFGSASVRAQPHPVAEPVPAAGAHRRFGRRTLLAAATVGVVAIAAASVAVVIAGRSSGHEQPGRPSPSATIQVTPAAAAATFATQLLDQVQLPAGARRVDVAPISVLDHPGQVPLMTTLVTRTRFWTVPESRDAVDQAIKANPPAGWRLEGAALPGGTDGVIGPFFAPVANGELVAYSEVVFSIAAMGSGSAVRADAEVSWQPQRTAADLVPSNVSRADVTIERMPSAPNVHRVLTGSDGRALAAAANALRVDVSGPHSCPMALGGYRDTIVFGSGADERTFVVEATGCRGVDETAPGVTSLSLVGGDFNAAILKALGLPANYGPSDR